MNISIMYNIKTFRYCASNVHRTCYIRFTSFLHNHKKFKINSGNFLTNYQTSTTENNYGNKTLVQALKIYLDDDKIKSEYTILRINNIHYTLVDNGKCASRAVFFHS